MNCTDYGIRFYLVWGFNSTSLELRFNSTSSESGFNSTGSESGLFSIFRSLGFTLRTNKWGIFSVSFLPKTVANLIHVLILKNLL